MLTFMLDLAEKLQPQHTALLVVDMQNDYCHPDGAIARSKGLLPTAAMLPRLNGLIEAGRQAGARVVFVQTTHDEWTDSPVRKALPRYQSMYLCKTGTWGAEFYGISPQPEDLIITKHRFSAFLNTPLELVLRANRLHTVIVAGVATHVCVDCTARDAFQRDFFVVIPADCTATSDPQLQEATLANLERHYGDVTTSDEIRRIWQVKGAGVTG